MSKYLKLQKVSVVDRHIGKQLKLGGYRPSPHDPHHPQYETNRFSVQELPPRVDLRHYLTKVEDQGEVASCTANAMAGAYEYLAKRILGKSSDVSRLFIYYNARYLDDDTDADNGTTLTNCIKVLRKWGTCPESTWPYDPEKLFDEPDEKAYDQAAYFLIKEAQRVPVDLYAMKHCLAEGHPFAFGIPIFESFMRKGNKGIPMPNPQKERNLGGHAMLCVGYSDQNQVFVVRNSWGTNWGDNGYCYIPYDYLVHPDYNDGDCWTIRSVTDLDFSQAVWFEDDSVYQLDNGEEEEYEEVDDDEEYDEDEYDDEDDDEEYDEDEYDDGDEYDNDEDEEKDDDNDDDDE